MRLRLASTDERTGSRGSVLRAFVMDVVRLQDIGRLQHTWRHWKASAHHNRQLTMSCCRGRNAVGGMQSAACSRQLDARAKTRAPSCSVARAGRAPATVHSLGTPPLRLLWERSSVAREASCASSAGSVPSRLQLDSCLRVGAARGGRPGQGVARKRRRTCQRPYDCQMDASRCLLGGRADHSQCRDVPGIVAADASPHRRPVAGNAARAKTGRPRSAWRAAVGIGQGRLPVGPAVARLEEESGCMK